MNNIYEKIKIESKKALIRGDKNRRKVLSFLQSEIDVTCKNDTCEPINDICINIINKLVKKNDYVHTTLLANGRLQTIAELENESTIYKDFLPEQLSDTDVTKIVQSAITELNAKSIKDMGRIMSKIMPQLRGKVDGKKLSSIVRKCLHD